LSEIAPTVTFTYGKEDYLQQHIEIGKVVNKEEEATAWVDDFKQRATDIGDKVRDKIGEDTTISVVESFDKQLDRKSTRLNSSHVSISYAVFCLKKKKKKQTAQHTQQ